MDTATVLERFEHHLQPVLGPLMASSAIRAQRQRLGVSGSRIDAGTLSALIDALAKGTRVFAGAARTNAAFEGLTERVIQESTK